MNCFKLVISLNVLLTYGNASKYVVKRIIYVITNKRLRMFRETARSRIASTTVGFLVLSGRRHATNFLSARPSLNLH